MKIMEINIPEKKTAPYGLKPIKIEKLGQTVLIAGKNGSGKTRVLELLKATLVKYPSVLREVHLKGQIEQNLQNIKIYENEISLAQTNIIASTDKTEIEQLKVSKDNYLKHITKAKSAIDHHQENLDLIPYISFEPYKVDDHLIDFVPKSLNLKDSHTISSRDIERESELIYNKGIQGLSEGTISAIEKIQRDWVNVNTTIIDDISISREEVQQINIAYARLKLYIKTFLNTELKRTKSGAPELFGMRIGEAKLSDGQKVLLQFCMALYAQETSLENLIIFMDEPENHLHPAALIEVLDKIVQHVKNGQLWIATHSINVLAHFDPSCIWYIEDGNISYAGNVPKKVLDGLLGDEEEMERLSSFLSLPAQIATTKFAYESLFYPKVLITGPNDPQVDQIHRLIKARKESGQKLSVLDFGIGKGRLLSSIFENERLRDESIIDWLDFYGFDIDPTNKPVCIDLFQKIYGFGTNRYFNETKEALSILDSNTLDFVIMSNVFHEINPSDWLSMFNSATSLFQLLKEDGYLLVVEDQFLAVGEKAHSKGFLVFDSLEFKKLFKMTSSDSYHCTDYRGDGRLKSHHIPKACLNRIDSNSRKDAISILAQNALDEIKKVRLQDPSFKNGKLHGFWAQQHANASIALEEL